MSAAAHAAGAACAAAAVLLVAGAEARATRDRPPPGHTGGFGEPTCHACHFMAEPNSGPGSLTIQGLPGHYEPGAQYTIVVELTHPGMSAAGFQLAVRGDDGQQAGTLEAPPDEGARTAIAVQDGVAYAHQLDAGARPGAAGQSQWRLVWTAPEGHATVHVHAAANAGDDDSSPLGDFVYTASIALPAH